MQKIFPAKTFNQDISGWDVSKVKDMKEMFKEAEVFDQDISGWDVSKVTSYDDFNTDSSLQENFLPSFP